MYPVQCIAQNASELLESKYRLQRGIGTGLATFRLNLMDDLSKNFCTICAY